MTDHRIYALQKDNLWAWTPLQIIDLPWQAASCSKPNWITTEIFTPIQGYIQTQYFPLPDHSWAMEDTLPQLSKTAGSSQRLLQAEDKSGLEDTPSTCVDCTKTVNCYLKKQDWRVRNMSSEMVSEVSLLQFKGGRDARNHILKGYQNSSYTGGNLHREPSILCKYPLSWSSHPTCFTKISYIQTFGSLSELPTKTNTVYEHRAAGCKGRMPRDKDKECP